MSKASISIIIPALNEENNLAATVQGLLEVIGGNTSDYEILIFDDGSTDRTGEIAAQLARNNPKVKAIHNKKNHGFGYNFREGVRLATMDYLIMIPGDNEISVSSIAKILALIGEVDIISPYTINSEIRSVQRQVISKLFVDLMNHFFGLGLRYYNGPVMYRSKAIKTIKITSEGFAYQAEVLIKLIKSGYSFAEIGMYINPRKTGRSKAFALKNIISVAKTIVKLILEVKILNRNTYSNPIRRVELQIYG